MVRVEWQYSQFENIARSSHFIPGPYFIHTQSAVRSPQSAVRNPRSLVRSPQSVVSSPQSAVWPQSTAHSRSETLYLAALCTYNAARLQQKHTYQWKNIQIISLKTSRPWYRQALDCCWRNISPRDDSTKTWNTPSLQDDRHLVCSRATSGFTLPHPSQLYLVCFQFLFLSNTKIKKRFSFRISSSLILFPAVSLHMNSFVKFEFLISWNLWNRKLKIQFSLRYQAKVSKLKIIV